MRFAPSEAGGGATPGVKQEEASDPIAIAYSDGFAAGHDQARQEAEAQAMVDQAALRHFSLSFSKLDADLAEALRDKMHQTVTALCESVLHPLALDAGALARRVETAVAMFVRADDDRVIRLHPDDITLLAAKLPPDWTFVPDPSLDRGALRVETSSGGIEDGPVQWRAAITEALRLC